MLAGAQPARVAPREAPRKLAAALGSHQKPPETPPLPLAEVLRAAGFPLMENSAGTLTAHQNRTSICKTVIVTEAVPRCRHSASHLLEKTPLIREILRRSRPGLGQTSASLPIPPAPRRWKGTLWVHAWPANKPGGVQGRCFTHGCPFSSQGLTSV